MIGRKCATWGCLALLTVSSVNAEYLFDVPGASSAWIWEDGYTPVGFILPSLPLYDYRFEYSAWDIFYAPHSAPNYPDIFAPSGGVYNPGTDEYDPTQWNPSYGIPSHPTFNPTDPFAFWHTYNPTITQTQSTTAFIIGPDVAGNIYTFQDKTAFRLHQATTWGAGESLQTVIFQFQTDGTNVDFGNIRLGYRAEDGNIYYLGVNDPQTEYLREYSTTSSDHWSASAGYRNRVQLQWDLSGVTTTEFWIEWQSQSSSMSFQKADLITASYYEVGMPVSSTWIGTGTVLNPGEWNDSSNWTSQAGGTPLENGNLKFKNATASALNINDDDHVVGEIIFDNAAAMTIGSSADYKLISNTGITTRNGGANTEYTFNADYELGALNFFEVNTGKVIMNGDISGNYGLVKLGAGTLEMNGTNTFNQFLAVQGGTLRITGSNSYSGSTNVVNGRIIVANNNALGTSSSALNIGGDASMYAFTTGSSSWFAELLLEGDRNLTRHINLGAGDLGKRLGAYGTTNGATFSGNISFSGLVSDPDAPGGASAVGNTWLTAQTATDILTFSGQVSGGAATKTVTLDGQGKVVFSGVAKTYNTSTLVQSGALEIATGSAYTGNGNMTVNSRLIVNGSLGGTGALTLNNGSKLSGNGEIGRTLTITGNATVSPGNSAVGELTFTNNLIFGASGVYEWELQNAVGIAGQDYDTITVLGSLNITSTNSNPFLIGLHTLNVSGTAGMASDFSGFTEGELYSWILLSTSDGITGFADNKFQLNLSGFANDYDADSFSLSLSEDQRQLILNYQYTSVPEPGRMALLALALTMLLMRRRRAHQPFPL